MATRVVPEKAHQKNLKELKDAIEKKTGKTPEQLYDEREKRIRDAIQLKEPDRVPLSMTMSWFPARYVGGVTLADAYYNLNAWQEAVRKTVLDFEPDLYTGGTAMSGPALEAVGPKFYRWPGDSLEANSMQQVLEPETLKPEEYDLLLSDPGDFTLRYYLPRVWKALEPLSRLPSLQSLWGSSTVVTRSAPFGKPEVLKAFEALYKAGQEQEKYARAASNFDEEIASLGFPARTQGNAQAPFDVVSDHLRGMAGAMLDMFRYPDKLIKLCEMLLPKSIESGLLTLRSKRGNPKRVGSALHRGSDGFMSIKQFETFYWPTWKKLVVALTDKGLVHIPFYEGVWDQRLEHLLELPKGKMVAHFAETDLVRAKAVLGGHTCIMAGIPPVVLQTGSPQEVEEHCRKLIKICGKGGGFILITSGLTYDCKPENVKALVDTVRKYGRY